MMPLATGPTHENAGGIFIGNLITLTITKSGYIDLNSEGVYTTSQYGTSSWNK